VRKNDIKFVEKNDSGTEIYLLSHHEVSKQMDTYFVRFVRNSDSTGLFANNIGQAFCHVISGKISFELEGKNYLLGTGDSIYFNAKVPYRAKNNTAAICELIWVITPASF